MNKNYQKYFLTIFWEIVLFCKAALVSTLGVTPNSGRYLNILKVAKILKSLNTCYNNKPIVRMALFNLSQIS